MKPSQTRMRGAYRLSSKFDFLAKACAAVATVLLYGIALTSTASAQGPLAPPFPVHSSIDRNGVDLNSGTFTYKSAPISVGDGSLGISQSYLGRGYRDNLVGTMTGDFVSVTVSVGGESTLFYTFQGGDPTTMGASPAKLKYNSTTKLYTYTAPDGSIAIFDTQLTNMLGVRSETALIKSLRKPNGLTYTYYYRPDKTLSAVVTSSGYMIKYSYGANGLSSVTALNLSVDACDPTANSCTYSRAWPSKTYSGNIWASGSFTETDATGGITTYTLVPTVDGTPEISNIVSPLGGVTAIARSFLYEWPSVVSSVTSGGNTWGYGYTVIPWNGQDSYTFTGISAGNASGAWHYSSRDPNCGMITSYQTGDYSESYTLNTPCLYKRVTYATGKYIEYTYDSIGRVTDIGEFAAGGGQYNSTFTYDPACPATSVACNSPIAVTDKRGNTSTFTYDPTHGGVLTATAPAPTAGAVQPQVRTSYAAFSAWYKNSAGSIVQAATPIYLPTSTSQCATLGAGVPALCANSADEVVSSTVYQVGSASAASNLLPISISQGNSASGAAALLATTSFTYTPNGDVNAADGPLPGTADTTRSFYDAMRRVTAVIGPDPDAAGARRNRATYTTYNANGQPILMQLGSTAGQSGTTPPALTQFIKTAIEYDVMGRKLVERSQSGTTTTTNYAVTQYAYDGADRLLCQTVRMNINALVTLPASACDVGTAGSTGPDRVTHFDYDGASRVTQVVSGYGLPAAQTRVEKTVTYTNTGKESTVADGKGNLTTYEYDGFDRLQKVRYPNSSGGGSSTTDFDLYGYDPNNNRVTWQRRYQPGADPALSTITYSFDALNRTTHLGGSGVADVDYTYDNLGRQLSSAYSSGGANVVATYDALGRMLTETTDGQQLSYKYDLAGNRTRLTWPDAMFMDYLYTDANETKQLRENGSVTTLLVPATYTYDNIGRRTQMQRGNSVITGYGYDQISRPSTLLNNLPGAAQDGYYVFGRNPASQLISLYSNNTIYDWTGSATARSYSANGLNQLITAGAANLTYDARGNLTSDGTTNFNYDLLNRLTSTGSATLSYDATGRLRQVVGGGNTTRFLYSGPDLVAEYNGSGTMLRRYTPGPGVDEPINWYEGSGVADRRWMISDSQGSVVGITNSTGALTNINKYDEYGVPDATNVGRFQYTGQAWLPEVGLYYYKARLYSPTLGRFLQADPTGYDDGLNWYAYVGNDPINKADPTGLRGKCGEPFVECYGAGSSSQANMGLVRKAEAKIETGSYPKGTTEEERKLLDHSFAMVDEARKAGQRADAKAYWDMVKTRGVLDYKNRDEWRNISERQRERYGNWIFGYAAAGWEKGLLGRSVFASDITGMGESVLRKGAGAYQMFFQGAGPRWSGLQMGWPSSIPCSGCNYGDNPGDGPVISRGYDAYRRY